ncbi:MAG TPA: glycosyltransferase family 2 protein, partial [Cyanobacteria bacterium UBA11162]|nr:glycosyltransferase family 2 protein [Cyanobacteria bacterium UBA11162]
MPLISIVIPVRNRKEYTKNILSEIQTQISEISQNGISIIVVDDGSTDGTTQIISSEFPQVHLIQGDGSLWWTGAIKLGMEYALDQLASDYIIWLNDDIFLREDFIEKAIEICTSPQYQDAVI